MRRSLLIACLFGASACGAAEAPPPPTPARATPSRQSPPPAVSGRPRASTAPAASAAPAAAPSTACSAEFPPANFRPPFERSAQPGDGEWRELEAPGARTQGSGLMYKAVVHPHAVSKWMTVTLVAIDLCKTSLHLVAGTAEPKNDAAPPESRQARVPAPDQASLLAVMNGGYKTAHGHFGMRAAGFTFVPAKPDACTLVIRADGSVALGTLQKLDANLDEARAFRQTPPCLLEQGELHPELARGNERAWGGRDPKRKTRRRSAMGIDASGRTLYYAFGEECGPRVLADGLKLGGATAAAQFDINYSWTRFLLYGDKAGGLGVAGSLGPKMVQRKGGYLERDEPRDFFYVTRKSP